MLPTKAEWVSFREYVRERAQDPTEDFPYGLLCFYADLMLTWKFWALVLALSFTAWALDLDSYFRHGFRHPLQHETRRSVQQENLSSVVADPPPPVTEPTAAVQPQATAEEEREA